MYDVSGSGSIVFDSNSSNTLNLTNSIQLTIDSGITVEGQNGTIGTAATGTLINDGTIAAQNSGRLTIDPASFTNNGTIDVTAGSTVNVTGSFTNFDGIGTLTGGTYLVAGTFEFAGANIVTNTASITLDGPTSAIINTTTAGGALASFATNHGSFTLMDGRPFTTAGGFTNAGTLTVDATGGPDNFTVAGTFTQTAGTTTLVAGGVLASTTATNIQGGTLAGSGLVSGNVSVDGTLSPGTAVAAGLLNVAGNLTLKSDATLTAKLTGPNTTNPHAGGDYDQVSVTGTVTLNSPVLDVIRLSGYVPAVGAAFTVLNNAGGSAVNGTFNGLVQGSTLVLDGVSMQITYVGGDGNDVQLTTAAPSTVYVDAAWAGTTIGADPASDPIGGLVFGYDAFADIPSALTQVAAGGTVVVYGGTYSSPIDVTKSLLGIQASVNPRDASPPAQVTLDGAVTIGTDTAFDMATAGLDFGSTVNDDIAGTDMLTIMGGRLTPAIFSDIVGGSRPLKAINDQASMTHLNTTSITTSGGQSYGGTTTLGADITLTSTGAGAIALGNVNGAFSLTVNTAGSTTFNGAVVGLASVTTDAPGTTSIDANVTTTGGQSYNDAVTLGASVTLTAQVAAINGGTLNLGANTLTVSNSDSASAIASHISGSGNLVMAGTGTLTLTNAGNSYTGTTSVQAGTLSISSDGDLGTAPAVATPGAITLANGGVLQLANGAATVTLNANRGITLGTGGGTIDTESETLHVAGNITGGTGLTKTGSGDLVLTGSNTPGTVAIDAGRLLFASQAALGSGAVGVAAGTTLDYTGAAALAVANTITFADGAAVASENATLTLPASTVLPTAGTIIFNDDSVPTAGVVVQAAVTTTGNLTVQVGGLNASVGSVDWTGSIGGTGGLIKTQSGTLTLTATNTYQAGTTIDGGTLQVSDDVNLGAAAGGVTIDAATLEVTSDITTARALTLGSVATTVQVDAPNTLTLTTAAAGSGSLTLTGGGTLDLSGLTNTFGGSGQSVTVSGSTLRVNTDANFGDAANTVVLAGGTLQATGTFLTNRGITLDVGGGTVDTNGNNVTLTGVVGGTAGLTKAGAGTLTLTGTNTYAGGAVVNAGTLIVNADANLGDSAGTLTINAATLDAATGFTTARHHRRR